MLFRVMGTLNFPFGLLNDSLFQEFITRLQCHDQIKYHIIRSAYIGIGLLVDLLVKFIPIFIGEQLSRLLQRLRISIDDVALIPTLLRVQLPPEQSTLRL